MHVIIHSTIKNNTEKHKHYHYPQETKLEYITKLERALY